MGKRNAEISAATEDTVDDKQTNKKRKLSNTDAINVNTNKSVQKKRNKRNKNNVVANDTKQDSDVECKQSNKIDKHSAANIADGNVVNTPAKEKTKKKDKIITVENVAIKSNKKIKFNEDGQVQDSPQNPTKGNAGNKTKQFLSGEEAAVTEEEIDRFCDEVDEEDNVQFENWVKLIEEKLKPSKNKKT